MQEIINIIVLGVVQGITEFLPISSSGHLAILQSLMGITEGSTLLTVCLHAGTLLSIIIYYRKDLYLLFRDKKKHEILLIAIGTAPLVLLGIPLNSLLKQLEGNLWVVVAGLSCTAVMLIFIYQRNRSEKELTIKDGILTGIFQCIAIFPGVSRSGSTIAIATRLDIRPDKAARYSFYLAIPAICGAMVLQLKDLIEQQQQGIKPAFSLLHLGIGFGVAALTGYIALSVLIKTLEKKAFAWFGYYCACLALALSLWIIFN